jgi:Bacterial PH domain
MTAAVFRKTPPGARVFRSGVLRVGGWVWMVFAALNFVDLIWRGRDMASAIAAAAMLLGSGLAYAVALRPRIVADDEAVQFHNLLRDVRLPWEAVTRFEGGDAVYAHVGDRRFRAFILQTSPRARARSEMKARREEKKLPEAVAAYMRGRTATDFTVEQLRELAGQHRSKDGTAEASVVWAWPPILALVVPAVLTAVTIVLALV